MENGKAKNSEKVYRLRKRYAPDDDVEKIRDIECSDEKLRMFNEDGDKNVRK